MTSSCGVHPFRRETKPIPSPNQSSPCGTYYDAATYMYKRQTSLIDSLPIRDTRGEGGKRGGRGYPGGRGEGRWKRRPFLCRLCVRCVYFPKHFTIPIF